MVKIYTITHLNRTVVTRPERACSIDGRGSVFSLSDSETSKKASQSRRGRVVEREKWMIQFQIENNENIIFLRFKFLHKFC